MAPEAGPFFSTAENVSNRFGLLADGDLGRRSIDNKAAIGKAHDNRDGYKHHDSGQAAENPADNSEPRAIRHDVISLLVSIRRGTGQKVRSDRKLTGPLRN